MLGHSVSYYLPSFWATTPLYAEKIIPFLDTALSVNSPKADKLALAYYDIWNKFRNPGDMTEANIREFIKDHGYEYILNLLSSSSETLHTLLFLLPMIHYLKGSKYGIELVFSLLQLNAIEINTEITEWWQAFPMETEDTFSITSDIDLSMIDSSFFQNFDTFIQKYVHPTLSRLNVSYTLSGAHTVLPVVTIFNTIDLKGVMDI